jgi:RNA-binding protein 5/10
MRSSKPNDPESSKREATSGPDQQKKKRKVEPATVARKPAAQLEKWANKRQELKGELTKPVESQYDVSEFADLTQMCCLLCKRKFQSVEEIQKHERVSKLHKVPFHIVCILIPDQSRRR